MFSGQIEFEPSESNGSGVDSNRYSALNQQISDRLLLRPLSENDAPALFALVDTNRTHLEPWMPWVHDTQTLKDSLQFIQTSHERARQNSALVSAICYDTQLVGLIDFNAINWQNRSAAIGYWLAAPYQGQGIMTRACRAMLSYGFETLNLNRIEISCATQNIRSQAIAKRLNLTYEGTFREVEWVYDHFLDHRVYSILQRDWPTRT